jgi:hypothetical protein
MYDAAEAHFANGLLTSPFLRRRGLNICIRATRHERQVEVQTAPQIAYPNNIGHFAYIESGRKPLVHFVESAYTIGISYKVGKP